LNTTTRSVQFHANCVRFHKFRRFSMRNESSISKHAGQTAKHGLGARAIQKRRTKIMSRTIKSSRM
jgi:hypothetical protein